MSLVEINENWTPSDAAKQRSWRAKMNGKKSGFRTEALPEPDSAARSAIRSLTETFNVRFRALEKRVNDLNAGYEVLSKAFEPLPGTPQRVSIERIIATTAVAFNCTVADIKGRKRCPDIVTIRHVACYLAKQFSGRTFAEIGRKMGGRDHTSIINGCRNVALAMRRDAIFCQEVVELEAMFA